MQSGSVFNIQRYSVQDGPGIRTTIFLKGCPLCCWWCHNPEGRSAKPEILVQEGRCLACGECRAACPFSGGDEGKGPLMSRDDSCLLCGACVAACPAEARQMVGRQMTVKQVMEEVLKDRIFYDQSGGGASFSGGEPLAQPEFLVALLEACRDLEIHTTVDTCGYGQWEHLESVAGLTDLFLYDLKVMDDSRHQRLTGVSNLLILENLRLLGRIHSNIWVRVPIVPGINDNREDLDAVASFAAAISGVRQVNLLPYHRSGLHKARRLGQSYPLADTPQPSVAQMEEYKERFRAFGLQVYGGG